MEDCQIKIEDEYKKLGCDNKEINNSKKSIRKVNSDRKISCSILKRERTRKASNFIKEKIKGKSNSGIKWDNKSINEQIDYRKNHPLDKEKLKNSISKFTNSMSSNGNDEDDAYFKALNKVYQINVNDELINKVINSLNDNNNLEKCLKRNKSCLIIGECKHKFNLKNFYYITEKEKMFDDSLGEEQKLTLQNTLYNKISKEVKDKENCLS